MPIRGHRGADPSRAIERWFALLWNFDISQLDECKAGVIGWFMEIAIWAYSGQRYWHSVAGFERNFGQ